MIKDGFRQKPVFTATVLMGLVFTLLAVWSTRPPNFDTASYYGRMAAEFATGNYDRAFYHMIPPLVPALAGVVAKTGLDPVAALRLVSGLFYVGGLWWLYNIDFDPAASAGPAEIVCGCAGL